MRFDTHGGLCYPVTTMQQERPSLIQITLPEYRGRHIFTARLRIAVFIGFWALYLYFYQNVLGQVWPITAIMSVSFIMTAFAYYNVIRDRWLIFSFILELMADMVALTVVVYLSGGPYSEYFSLYIFYCFAAGVFYNYLLTALLAVCALTFYGVFLVLCLQGIIPPMILNYGDLPPLHANLPHIHFALGVIFMGLAIYGVKIASFFSQQRERALDALNLEASRLIEELKNTNTQLKEANRVKSEFLAIMSHELRTPLTAIIGFSELLLEGVMGELTAEQKESLREVLNNGADLLEMINSLLDLSKIDSGKMKLDARPFNFVEMVERVQRTIASLIQRKRHTLVIDAPDAPPVVEGDERKLQQVLLNLVSNAIKFTPPEGTITVRMRRFVSWDDIARRAAWAPRVARHSDAYQRGALELVVEDNGVGIDAPHLEVIFDMFQQVDSSITRSFGGTGLGLALAKQFIELHGGAIWAESELGKGAKFTTVLPITNEGC